MQRLGQSRIGLFHCGAELIGAPVALLTVTFKRILKLFFN